MKNNRILFGALILVLIIGVFLINYIAATLSERYPLTIDLTAGGLFEISDRSIQLARSLSEEVTINILAKEDDFMGSSAYMAQANEIIRQYAKYGSTISLNYVNYVADPTFASNYPDVAMKHGDILISCGEKNKVVPVESLFNYTQSSSGATTIASSKVDETIASAILNVTGGEQITVSILTGHGEYSMPSFINLLQINNYNVVNLNLITDDFDPACKVAVLIAPHKDLNEDVLKKIDDFLYNNGKYGKTLFYTADTEQDILPNLEQFLKEWGVEIGDGAVFETDSSRVYNYHPFYAIADYSEEDEVFYPMLRDRRTPMLMPLSRPLSVLYEYRNNNSTTVLLKFGDSTAVRPSDAPDEFTWEDAVIRGPLPALVLAQQTVRDKESGEEYKSYVIVSGSAGMLDGYSIDNSSLANSEYLLNILNTVCQREDVFKIPSKSITGKALNISTGTANRLGLIFALIIPLLIIGAGVGVWLYRRHQ